MLKYPVWIEMPATGTGAADDPVRSKYPIEGNAFIVHCDGKIYAMLDDGLAIKQVAMHPDCRRLTHKEARELAQRLPFPVPQRLDWLTYQNGTGGLGDLIGWVAQKLGIAECYGCQRRKRWLNQIGAWRWGVGRLPLLARMACMKIGVSNPKQ
jgi:hypothetical protein